MILQEQTIGMKRFLSYKRSRNTETSSSEIYVAKRRKIEVSAKNEMLCKNTASMAALSKENGRAVVLDAYPERISSAEIDDQAEDASEDVASFGIINILERVKTELSEERYQHFDINRRLPHIFLHGYRERTISPNESESDSQEDDDASTSAWDEELLVESMPAEQERANEIAAAMVEVRLQNLSEDDGFEDAYAQ